MFFFISASHATVTVVNASVTIAEAIDASVDSLVIPLSRDRLNSESSSQIKLYSLPKDTQVSFSIQHDDIVLKDREGNTLVFKPIASEPILNVKQVDDQGAMIFSMNGTLLAQKGQLDHSANYVGSVKMWVNF